MDYWLYGVAFFFAGIAIYRKVARWRMTPKMRVRSLLRRYRTLERKGLSEQDCRLQLLATSKDWKNLPHHFLAEIVSRLATMEATMRFASVSEDYGYLRDHYPGLAAKTDLEAAMGGVACLFARLGFELQEKGRYKEAVFVQSLALRLQPDQYFTNLPLAVSYHETGRYAEALPLFERGLAQVNDLVMTAGPAESESAPENFLLTVTEIRRFRNRCKKMYATCLKETEVEKQSAQHSQS